MQVSWTLSWQQQYNVTCRVCFDSSMLHVCVCRILNVRNASVCQSLMNTIGHVHDRTVHSSLYLIFFCSLEFFFHYRIRDNDDVQVKGGYCQFILSSCIQCSSMFQFTLSKFLHIGITICIFCIHYISILLYMTGLKSQIIQ